MTCITCGLMMREMFYPILMAIFLSSSLYGLYYMNYNGFLKEDFWVDDRYIFSVLPLIGQMLSGIIEIIRRLLKPNEPLQDRYSTDSYMLGIKSITNETMSKKWFIGSLVIIASLLNTSVIGLKSIYIISNEEFLWLIIILRMIKIVFTGIIGKYILSSINYKHHYYALGIVLIGMGIIFGIEIKSKIDSIHFQWNYMLVILIGVSNSFQEILEKQLMDQYFVPQYLLCTLEGFVGLLLMIVAIISFGTKMTLLFNYLGFYPYAFVIFILIFQCAGIFRLLTIQRYTPLHKTVADSLTLFCMIMIFFMFKEISDNVLYLCIDVIGFILVMFGYVIYNDIIILNICNLNEYTSKELRKRGDSYKNKINEIEENYTIAGFFI